MRGRERKHEETGRQARKEGRKEKRGGTDERGHIEKKRGKYRARRSREHGGKGENMVKERNWYRGRKCVVGGRSEELLLDGRGNRIE